MIKTILVTIVAVALTGCSTLTPTQKKVVTVIAIGTAAAVIAAHQDGGSKPRQFPCGCTPPPAVK